VSEAAVEDPDNVDLDEEDEDDSPGAPAA